MPNIIGEFCLIGSTVPPLDAHIGHLRHLTNPRIAQNILRERHHLTAAQARDNSKLLSAHIKQALDFHFESRLASPTVRPVLQYYCYLNLSVAAILAFRPPNFDQYRRHGVEDKTHALSKLDLSSVVLVVKRGAVPLFHSIVSDLALYNRRFRFGQLAAGFHMFHHELATQFNKITQAYFVTDQIMKDGRGWHSIFTFTEYVNGKRKKVAPKRLENAMPILASQYTRDVTNPEQTEYTLINSLSTESAAMSLHRSNGLKIVNFGGHGTRSGAAGDRNIYAWRGMSRSALMPTLSSVLLLSFSLASIARYRPILLDAAMNSPVALLVDTFVTEADTVFIPSLRNLLYREEVAVGQIDFV